MWINAAYLSFTWQLQATLFNFQSQCLCNFHVMHFINNYTAQYTQKVIQAFFNQNTNCVHYET